MIELILYGVVMVIAMTMAGIIGFAANVIALPLLSMFLPLNLVVSMLVLIAALQSGVQAFRVRRPHSLERTGAYRALSRHRGCRFGLIMLNYLPELALKAIRQRVHRGHRCEGIGGNPRAAKNATHLSGAPMAQAAARLLRVYFRRIWLRRSADRHLHAQPLPAIKICSASCSLVAAHFPWACRPLGHVASGSYTIASLPYVIIGLVAVCHRAARQHLAREADEHHVFPAAGQRRAAFLCALADVAGGARRVGVTLDIARPS